MTENQGNKRPAVWDITTSHPDLAAKAKEILHGVQDPELGYSVVDLGLIRNIAIKDKAAVVTMILTTPFCPYGQQLVDSVRQYATKALRMPVMVDLKMDPWDPI